MPMLAFSSKDHSVQPHRAASMAVVLCLYMCDLYTHFFFSSFYSVKHRVKGKFNRHGRRRIIAWKKFSFIHFRYESKYSLLRGRTRRRCLSERGNAENKRWGEERLQSVKSAISCRWTVKPWRPYKANTPEKESHSLSVTLWKGNVTRSKWRKEPA